MAPEAQPKGSAYLGADIGLDLGFLVSGKLLGLDSHLLTRQGSIPGTAACLSSETGVAAVGHQPPRLRANDNLTAARGDGGLGAKDVAAFIRGARRER